MNTDGAQVIDPRFLRRLADACAEAVSAGAPEVALHELMSLQSVVRRAEQGSMRTEGGENPGSKAKWIRDGSSFQFLGARSERGFWAESVEIGAEPAERTVAVIGESVARGFLYDPEYSFAGELLRELGVHADGSRVRCLDLAKTDATLQDLQSAVLSARLTGVSDIVVFAGNNWCLAPWSPAQLHAASFAYERTGWLGVARLREQQLGRMVTEFLDLLSDGDENIMIVVPGSGGKWTQSAIPVLAELASAGSASELSSLATLLPVRSAPRTLPFIRTLLIDEASARGWDHFDVASIAAPSDYLDYCHLTAGALGLVAGQVALRLLRSGDACICAIPRSPLVESRARLLAEIQRARYDQPSTDSVLTDLPYRDRNMLMKLSVSSASLWSASVGRDILAVPQYRRFFWPLRSEAGRELLDPRVIAKLGLNQGPLIAEGSHASVELTSVLRTRGRPRQLDRPIPESPWIRCVTKISRVFSMLPPEAHMYGGKICVDLQFDPATGPCLFRVNGSVLGRCLPGTNDFEIPGRLVQAGLNEVSISWPNQVGDYGRECMKTLRMGKYPSIGLTYGLLWSITWTPA